MKHLKTYKVFESTSEGVSVFEIKEILIDLIHADFYIEVNKITNRGYGAEEETLNDDIVLDLNYTFGVDIKTKKLRFGDPFAADTSIDGETFRWDDVKDSIDHLISFLSEKYEFVKCSVN